MVACRRDGVWGQQLGDNCTRKAGRHRAGGREAGPSSEQLSGLRSSLNLSYPQFFQVNRRLTQQRVSTVPDTWYRLSKYYLENKVMDVTLCMKNYYSPGSQLLVKQIAGDGKRGGHGDILHVAGPWGSLEDDKEREFRRISACGGMVDTPSSTIQSE